MILITHGANLRMYLRCARPPPFVTQARDLHLNHSVITKGHASNHKIKEFSPFRNYTDPKDVELGLWKEDTGVVQRMSLAHALEKELGPGRLLVPHSKLENDTLITGKDGLRWYTVKELQTNCKIENRDLKGKGAKEVQLTQKVPALHFWHLMSKAWAWIDSQLRVEFHTRPRRKFEKDEREEFTDAINNTDSLHLRADVLLSALPKSSANIIRPLSDWQTRVCWVTVKTNLEESSQIRKVIEKEQRKLKKQIQIHDELVERQIALPSVEERQRMKDEVKARENFGAFRKQREAMFERIDKAYPLICPIVRRIAPLYAPADQLLYLARNIAWKLPRIKQLFNRNPIVYQKIRATITIDETKESVQARIEKMLNRGVKDPVLPAKSTDHRPLGALFTHPFLLGTKKFNPNEECCLQCGKVPCGKDHTVVPYGENMLSCPAPPFEWLPKWESFILRDWIFEQKKSFKEGVGNSDREDQSGLDQNIALDRSYDTTNPAHSVLANTTLSYSENEGSFQDPVPTKASGSNDLDGLRGIVKQGSLLVSQNIVRRLASKDGPDTNASPFKRLQLDDSPTDSSSGGSINREARQFPPSMDPDVKTFREELSSNQSHNLATTFEEDGPILPFIRKQAAFNPEAFTKPKPGGISRAVFIEKGEWLDGAMAAKPANRGSFRNFEFAGDGTEEAGVEKGDSSQRNEGPEKTFGHREMTKKGKGKVDPWEKKYAEMQKENALLGEQLRARQEGGFIPQYMNEALPHLEGSRGENGTQPETDGSTHRSYENSRLLTAPEAIEPMTPGALTIEAMSERIAAIQEENKRARRQNNGVTRSLVKTHGGLPGPSYTGVGTIRKKKIVKRWGRGVR